LTTSSELSTLAINAIRVLSIEAVQRANSGHPGLPMGAAPMAYALWMQHLRYNPRNPHWFNRDRFILSAGHGSMLLYSLLHLTGFDVSMEDIKNFRQWGSPTPGHPEYGETPGVETTTGPLGQGVANGVGMALAEAFLAKTFNTPEHAIIDHYTYVLAGDGDLMEGVAIEACALAGHWGLNKLIVLYDSNDITLDGEANMTFTEDIPQRFASQGWNVLRVAEGNEYAHVSEAIAQAKTETQRPTLIEIKTTIGYGSPNKANSSKAHGSPLGEDEVRLTKQALGWTESEPFAIPAEALAHFREAIEHGAQAESTWQELFSAWQVANPAQAQALDNALQQVLVEGWDQHLPHYTASNATRNAGGDALNAIATHFPTMIGGDADLAGSTKTLIKGANHTAHHQPAARNIRFGVREHAMGAIVNGLALHGGIIKPYSATFLTFSDYMRPAMRLGALMHLPAVYVFTHDSIGLGEDGPTHQSVEHVMALRLIPNLYVFRPADSNETVAAWRTLMTLTKPSAIILTRQNVASLSADGVADGVARGGYVLADSDGTPDVILMASGSEVEIAHEAYHTLTAEGIKARLVSLPCWELFDEQPAEYRESVLLSSVRKRVSIEAGVTTGWQKYVGMDGVCIGVDRFGASAPYEKVYEEYGITARAVIQAARHLLG